MFITFNRLFELMSGSEEIIRNCIVCSKELRIIVHEDSTYEGGYFFGRMKYPVGNGEHRKIGTTDMFGKKADVVKWTGDDGELEYWECENCSKED